MFQGQGPIQDRSEPPLMTAATQNETFSNQQVRPPVVSEYNIIYLFLMTSSVPVCVLAQCNLFICMCGIFINIMLVNVNTVIC